MTHSQQLVALKYHHHHHHYDVFIMKAVHYKRLCIFRPKGTIQIRYYYYYKECKKQQYRPATQELLSQLPITGNKKLS